MDPTAPLALGHRAMALLEQLSRYSDEPDRLTRLYLSPAHREAAEATVALMRAAGLAASIDAAGTVVGRRAGEDGFAPAVLVGSHIDTVVDGGRYDGTLGVVLGIVAVEALRAQGVRLAAPIEVVAFGDEENVRFPTSLSTASALAGRYDPAWLEGRDRHGTTLREALVRFGGDPAGIAALARDSSGCRAYLEVHIEQGPVLEAERRAVGIVSAINGATRARVCVTGAAGHAGTVPMALRRDALAAAAEMIAAVERIGAARADTVATVGAAEVQPGAINVIPARVDFTLDARAPEDPVRQAMVADIVAACEAIAARRKVAFSCVPFMDSPATPMDPELARIFEEAVAGCGVTPLRLASGAGHDAVAMANLCPCAMLFVRCRGGISHSPAESIAAEDADVAARVLIAALQRLAG